MHDRHDQMTSSRTIGAFTAVALALFSLVGAATAQPHAPYGPEEGLPSSEPARESGEVPELTDSERRLIPVGGDRPYELWQLHDGGS